MVDHLHSICKTPNHTRVHMCTHSHACSFAHTQRQTSCFVFLLFVFFLWGPRLVSNSLILLPQPQSEGRIIGLQHHTWKRPDFFLSNGIHRLSYKALRCLRLYFARQWKSVRPRSPSLTSHSGTDLEGGQLLDTTSREKSFCFFKLLGKFHCQVSEDCKVSHF